MELSVATLAEYLKVNPSVISLIIAITVLPLVFFTIARFTGSGQLGFLAVLVALISLAILGIIPMWACIMGGILGSISLIFSFSGLFGHEQKTIKSKEKILVQFYKLDHTIIEKWSDAKEYIIYENKRYKFSHQDLLLKRIKGKDIPTLMFREIEIDNKPRMEIVNVYSKENWMPNQLIQDPKKLGILKTDTLTAKETVNKNTNSKIDFASINFDRGIKVANKLENIHRQILPVFINSSELNSLVDIEKMKKLELDLYNQGTNVLRQVYEIAQQLQQSKVDELKSTHDILKKQLDSLDPNKIGMFNLLQDRLEINEKSLSMIKRYNDHIDELLCQVELYIESISEMCLELPELLNHKTKDDMDKTLLELKSRIEIAQRIHDEYTKEGL